MKGSMRGLQRELEELERTDPAVREARRSFDELPEKFARHERHMAARAAVGVRDKHRSEKRQ